MKLETFQGRTMAEALAKVKRRFGRDAVILNTRAFAKGGLFGIGAKPIVEITAARAMADLPSPPRRGRLSNESGRTVEADGAATPVSSFANNLKQPSANRLLSEMGDLKGLVSDLVRETKRARAQHVPADLHDTYLKLVENAVAEELAAELIRAVGAKLDDERRRDPAAVRRVLADTIRAMVPPCCPIEIGETEKPMLVALIGPTGVGKTTTIAKLAANFHFREQKRVGLITLDTYRIAAVEQLKTYAQIIDVPIEVAMSPTDFQNAVGAMGDREIILVDTAGRSQRDAPKIRQLREFFSAVRPHQIHLVLSGTCEEGILTDAIERFGAVGFDRVIFTKLDEAIGFGVMLSCLNKAGAALSYTTTGQDVPADIDPGCGHRLAELILGNSSLSGPAARGQP